MASLNRLTVSLTVSSTAECLYFAVACTFLLIDKILTFEFAMNSRKHLSGYQKRLRKNETFQQVKKMKGSIEKFIVSKNERNPSETVENENVVEEIEASSSSDKVMNCSESQLKLSDDIVGIDSEETVENENVASVIDIEASLSSETKMDSSFSQSQIKEISDDANETGSEEKDVLERKNNPESEFFSDDPALWPTVVTEKMREHFTLHKPDQFVSEIGSSKRFCGNKDRVLTEHNFYRHKKNNEKTKRDWLIYSPSKRVLFCYVCKLFSSNCQALSNEGYSNWKNVSERLKEHENSKSHRDSVCTLSLRLMSYSNLKSQMIEDYEKEKSYWHSVLCRVVATIKFLAERGLPIFGDNETLGSLKNGNYLGCLEYLAKFDPFIQNHLEKYGNAGKGNTNYLSSTIATELLHLMSARVLKEIVQEVLDAKYFGLIVDSTPDVTHIDQLSLILRYVNKEGVPSERFIKFIPIHNHSSSYLASTVLTELENLGLDILNCRGQSYDNASNMAGKYAGLQARIKDVSPLAEYVPCAAHSLNLVGCNAVQSCNQAVSYFGIVQNLYNFFSCSTHRWQILQQKLLTSKEKLTLKSLSNTRWSAEADATRALRKCYCVIRNLLYNISEDENESPATCHEAKNLYLQLNKLETALMTVIWDTILQRINMASKNFQQNTGDLSSLIPLYESLVTFMNCVREEFDTYEAEALTLVDGNINYANQRKKFVSKRLDQLPGNEKIFSPKENFKFMCHNIICDVLISQLEKRKEAYRKIHERFQFLYNMKSLPITDMRKMTEEFYGIYSNDIDDNFSDEFIQFQSFFNDHISPSDCLKKIRNLNISHTFPNVETAYHLFLTLPITNCSSERSFSVLKRIKSRLRSTMNQSTLEAFSLLSIENDITAKLDFEDIINDFASVKARKKPF